MLQIREKVLIERVGVKKLESFKRRSDREFDVLLEGINQDGNNFGAWMPLMGIKDLTNWGDVSVIGMADYDPRCGWSAIRDSERSTIWQIFDNHVVPQLVVAQLRYIVTDGPLPLNVMYGTMPVYGRRQTQIRREVVQQVQIGYLGDLVWLNARSEDIIPAGRS